MYELIVGESVTLDTDDLAQNAEGHRVIKSQIISIGKKKI